MSETTKQAEVPEYLRRVAEDYQRLGEELLQSREDSPFEAVTRLALDRVPAARAASITTVRHDEFVTTAATDDVARRTDHIQYQLGSGPCIDASVDQTVYQPKDLANDDRCPEYGRRVSSEIGLRSMLSFRMRLELAGVIAGLNFYAEEPDPLRAAR